MFGLVTPAAAGHDEDCPRNCVSGSPEWKPSRATRDLVPFGNWVVSRYSFTCSVRNRCSHCFELASEKKRSGKTWSGYRQQRGVHLIGGGPPRQSVSVLCSVIESSVPVPVAGKVLSYGLGSGQPKIGIDFAFDVIVAVISGGMTLAAEVGQISPTVEGTHRQFFEQRTQRCWRSTFLALHLDDCMHFCRRGS